MKDSPTNGSGAKAAAGASPKPDAVVPLGPTEDKRGAVVLRAREERIELGEIRPVEEGRPLRGELLVLKQRENQKHIYDVTDSYRPESLDAQKSGRPAQVATAQYRSNWEAIYGKQSLN